jgi:hypothetical protein
MSDHDRGPYTPSSDRLSFDPRRPVRSGGPAPVTLIMSALVLVAVVGGVFFLYRGGIRHKAGPPAAVGETMGPIKAPAPADATNDVPPGLVVEKVPPDTNATPNFAPPPQTPPPRVIVTSITPPPPPPPIVAATPAPPPANTIVASAKPAKPITIASLTDAAEAEGRGPKSPKPGPVTASTPTSAAPGASLVQIGAFSSEALADKGWRDVAQLEPAAMKGKGKKVEPLTRDGKDLYRTSITGFASRDAAEAFCGKLKAAGKDCIVK